LLLPLKFSNYSLSSCWSPLLLSPLLAFLLFFTLTPLLSPVPLLPCCCCLPPCRLCSPCHLRSPCLCHLHPSLFSPLPVRHCFLLSLFAHAPAVTGRLWSLAGIDTSLCYRVAVAFLPADSVLPAISCLPAFATCTRRCFHLCPTVTVFYCLFLRTPLLSPVAFGPLLSLFTLSLPPFPIAFLLLFRRKHRKHSNDPPCNHLGGRLLHA
jgi:hypothetical protein